MNVGFKIKDIENSQRPKEYVDALYQFGHKDGDLLIIDIQHVRDLWSKYLPEKLNELPKYPAKKCCLPPATEQAKNLVGAVGRVAKAALTGQRIRREEKEAERFVSICKSCEFFNEPSNRCAVCGCFVEVKTRWQTEHCPKNKW